MKAFDEKCAVMGGKEEVFEIFSQPLTPEESDALKFIYAYAPLADLTVDPSYTSIWYAPHRRPQDHAVGRLHTGRHIPALRIAPPRA